MKKLFVCCLFLILCGCSEVKAPIETTVSSINDSKEWSARESIKGYASSVRQAYMNYLSIGEVGDTAVNVDGSLVGLNVLYDGVDVICSNISIIDGSVKLVGCKVYNYEFDYDGSLIQK